MRNSTGFLLVTNVARSSLTAVTARSPAANRHRVVWSCDAHPPSQEGEKMDIRTFVARRALIAAGACFAFLLVAGPAAARPDDGTGNGSAVPFEYPSRGGTADAIAAQLGERQDLLPQAAVGIPYDGGEPAALTQLAGHRGHEEQAYEARRIAAEESAARAGSMPLKPADEFSIAPSGEPTVIPYLSHGLTTPADLQAVGNRAEPDGFQPQLGARSAGPGADHGFNWEATGFLAGALLAAMLAAALSTLALRERRGLKGA
jgi:hypothetical protein